MLNSSIIIPKQRSQQMWVALGRAYFLHQFVHVNGLSSVFFSDELILVLVKLDKFIVAPVVVLMLGIDYAQRTCVLG